MAISVEHTLLASESAYQHEQGGLRQMEIGEQRPHHPDFMAGLDKDLSLAVSSRNPS